MSSSDDNITEILADKLVVDDTNNISTSQQETNISGKEDTDTSDDSSEDDTSDDNTTEDDADIVFLVTRDDDVLYFVNTENLARTCLVDLVNKYRDEITASGSWNRKVYVDWVDDDMVQIYSTYNMYLMQYDRLECTLQYFSVNRYKL